MVKSKLLDENSCPLARVGCHVRIGLICTVLLTVDLREQYNLILEKIRYTQTHIRPTDFCLGGDVTLFENCIIVVVTLHDKEDCVIDRQQFTVPPYSCRGDLNDYLNHLTCVCWEELDQYIEDLFDSVYVFGVRCIFNS